MSSSNILGTTTLSIICEVTCFPLEPSMEEDFIGTLLKMWGRIQNPKTSLNLLKESFGSSKGGFRDRFRVEGDFPEAILDIILLKYSELTYGAENGFRRGM